MENNGDIDRRFAAVCTHSGATSPRRVGSSSLRRKCASTRATPSFTFAFSTHLSFYELTSCHICQDSAPAKYRYIFREISAGREIITVLRARCFEIHKRSNFLIQYSFTRGLRFSIIIEIPDNTVYNI